MLRNINTKYHKTNKKLAAEEINGPTVGTLYAKNGVQQRQATIGFGDFVVYNAYTQESMCQKSFEYFWGYSQG